MTQKIWKYKDKPAEQKVFKLSKALGVSKAICSLLVSREIDTFEKAKTFFRPQLDMLHDPFLMKDMDKATQRLIEAVANKEAIRVYGDYDVDGTTSVSLMYSFLKSQDAVCDYYIPDRYDEGYGVSEKGIEDAIAKGVGLLITLDCGVKAVEKLNYAQSKGLDVIVCDHHRPGEILPNAFAVLDPKRADCNYPFKELCGCGVGFKLVQAYLKQKGLEENIAFKYLDYVAVAIGADIVPIVDENRVLAYYGLKVLNEKPRMGMLALMKEHKRVGAMTITDVVFTIAPRINAAGRMKHAHNAVRLLIEESEAEAIKTANEIEEYNTERRAKDQQIAKEALTQIIENNEENRASSVVYDPSWHKGVIGIVASRLIETYYRPTLVFTKSGEMLAASARSVKGFDVYNALEKCSEYIEQFGGHKYAAGLTLKPENYKSFKAQFEKVVEETIDPKMLIPEISIDSQISLSDITPKFYRILSQFAPFGPGNMTPVFMTEDMQDTGYGKQVGEDKSHLRFTATQNGKGKIVGIGFGMGDQIKFIKNKKPFKAAYTIDENEWNGNKNLQLKLKDLKA